MERKDLPLIGPPGGPSRTAPPPPNPISLKGDPGRAESKPARTSEPTSRLVLPPEVTEAGHEADDAVLAQLGKIEQVVRDAKKAKVERDEARAKTARLEHELAQAREQIEASKATALQVEELQEKLDDAVQARDKATAAAAPLKARIEDLEGQLKKADERARSADEKVKSIDDQLKKQTNALSNAKEARDETQYRLDAALAAMQGKAIPPKPDKKY